jgi:hypothetical protein
VLIYFFRFLSSDAQRYADSTGVSEAFEVQKEIETQSRALQTEAVRFSQQTDKWMKSVQTYDTAVKEIGDFENWMKTMEWDMQTVATALENVASYRAQPAPPQR